MKNKIANNAEYFTTYSDDMETFTSYVLKLGKEYNKYNNDYIDKGIFFVIREYDTHGHISFSFNRMIWN